MRTRTTSNPVTINAGTYKFERRWPIGPPPGPVVETQLLSGVANSVLNTSNDDIITDELTYRKREGYCNHVVRRYVLPDIDAYFEKPVSGSGFNSLTLTGGFVALNYLRTRIYNWCEGSGVVVIRPWDWYQLSYEAVDAMTPKFSELSLSNDLLELKQIRDLVRPFGQMKTRIGKASSLLLWKQFGVDPVVQSIVGVVDLVRSLTERISDIRKRGTRLQTRHFRRNLDVITATPISTTPQEVYGENAGHVAYELKIHRTGRWLTPPRYTATLKFRYDVSSLTDLELKCRAWLQASGLDNLLSVVWNAIPFSFVIDWFFNVGEWVESLLSEPVIPIEIVDFSHSVKYGYRFDFVISMWSKLYVTPCASYERTFYERRRDIPATTATLHSNMPSAQNVVIGQALVGQSTDSARHKQSKKAGRRPPPLPLKIRAGIVKTRIFRPGFFK